MSVRGKKNLISLLLTSCSFSYWSLLLARLRCLTFIFYQKYFLWWNGLKAFLFSCYNILNGFRTTSADIFPVSSRTFLSVDMSIHSLLYLYFLLFTGQNIWISIFLKPKALGYQQCYRIFQRKRWQSSTCCVFMTQRTGKSPFSLKKEIIWHTVIFGQPMLIYT